MPESVNKNEGAPPRKIPEDYRPSSMLSSLFRWILVKIRNLPKFLQEKTSALLQWFSGVLEEAGDWKKVLFVLIKRAVSAIKRWVDEMKPLHFICLLGLLVVAILYTLVRSPPETPLPKIITLCLSEMGANADFDKTYVYNSNETEEAILKITKCFDIFDVRIFCKSNDIPPDDNRIVMDVLVSCYESDGSGSIAKKKLKVQIPKLKSYEEQKIYTSLSTSLADEVARKIKETVLAKYPPEGNVEELRPPGRERPSDYPASLPRTAILNIGWKNGVRKDDTFELVDPNMSSLFRRSRMIYIWDIESPERSTVHVPWEQDIKVGWRVKWEKSRQ
jgi:hypothetical protein